jgi:hypothetical protein
LGWPPSEALAGRNHCAAFLERANIEMSSQCHSAPDPGRHIWKGRACRDQRWCHSLERGCSEVRTFATSAKGARRRCRGRIRVDGGHFLPAQSGSEGFFACCSAAGSREPDRNVARTILLRAKAASRCLDDALRVTAKPVLHALSIVARAGCAAIAVRDEGTRAAM